MPHAVPLLEDDDAETVNDKHEVTHNAYAFSIIKLGTR